MDNEKIAQYERMVSEYLENNKWITNPETNTDPIISFMADRIMEEAMEYEESITEFMHSFEQFGEIYLIELHNRFKKKWRIEEKIQEKIVDGVPLNKTKNYIKDSLRYTFIVDDSVYTEKVEELIRSIEEKYSLYTFKNSWSNFYYKGVNCSFMLDNGFIFEVQFHTPMSYTVKEGKLRDVYNIIRNPNVDPLMVDISNAIRLYYQTFVKIPKGAIDFQYESKKQVK